MTYVVALTGGIASGKSTVSQAFEALGVDIIDTDVIARSLLQNKSPILDRVASAFGSQVMNESGNVDRSRLRSIIFKNEKKREVLNDILHPEILRISQEKAEASQSVYCLVVIPLLAEVGVAEWVDRVLVVDVPVEVQLDRLARRDKRTDEENTRIVEAQADRETRMAIADDVIDNTGTFESTQKAVRALDLKYRELASYKKKGITQ